MGEGQRSPQDSRPWGETAPAIAPYVTRLCQEIALAPVGGPPLQTVFLGGGTPSLLSPAQLAQILQALDQHFGLDAGAEISIEMDPGTFTLVQLRDYQAVGVNRVSLGVQAFADELLQVCGRSHDVQDVEAAIDQLHQAHVTNWSLDLISGLPGQTLDQWRTTLLTAIQYQPTHLSIYDLEIEPGTRFSQRYQPGESPLPTDATTAQMYRLASEVLSAAGYGHYEVSNYAQPGYQCRHNQVYWRNEPYYGFGMGATSYVQHQRYSRPRTLGAYDRWVQQLQQTQGQIEGAISMPLERVQDTLMLGLRLATGLQLQALEAQCGAILLDAIMTCLIPYQTQGWVDIHNPGKVDAAIRLTDPEGFLFSNRVLAALWHAVEVAWTQPSVIEH